MGSWCACLLVVTLGIRSIFNLELTDHWRLVKSGLTGNLEYHARRMHFDCQRNESRLDCAERSVLHHLPYPAYERQIAKLQTLMDHQNVTSTNFLTRRPQLSCELPVNRMIETLRLFGNAEHLLKFLEPGNTEDNSDLLYRLFIRLSQPSEHFDSPESLVFRLLNIEDVSASNHLTATVQQCFHDTQPLVTNSTRPGSACYHTQRFAQEIFDYQEHLPVILKLVAREARHNNTFLEEIRRALDQLRKLELSQWNHVNSICTDVPSFVIPDWPVKLDNKSLTTSVSFARSTCANLTRRSISSVAVRLTAAPSLRVECDDGTTLENTTTNALEFQFSHTDLVYYSQEQIKVDKLSQQFLCQVGFDRRHLHTNHHLIFLVAGICDLKTGKVIKETTSFSSTASMHFKLDMPIKFNSGPVGYRHPRPFLIFAMGLFTDERGRLAVNMSTAANLQLYNCSSQNPLLQKAPHHVRLDTVY